MALLKDVYTFKDKTWYIVPWGKVDPTIPELTNMPSMLIHDVEGYYPHRLSLWNYGDLIDDFSLCGACDCRPSKKIQTLWILENMDNPSFHDYTNEI